MDLVVPADHRVKFKESNNNDNNNNNKKKKKKELATVDEDDPKAPFSIATIPRCRGGHYSFPLIAPP